MSMSFKQNNTGIHITQKIFTKVISYIYTSTHKKKQTIIYEQYNL